MKVICIKLSSGEEVIAKTVSRSVLTEDAGFPEGAKYYEVPKNDILCEDVRIVSLQQVGPSQVGIAFIPWALGNPDGQVLINREHISAVYPASGELEKGYLGQTSGLAMPGTTAARPSLKM